MVFGVSPKSASQNKSDDFIFFKGALEKILKKIFENFIDKEREVC